jgi:hypothetical protein
MATEQELMACFDMPKGRNIGQRMSSMTNAFAAAITPVAVPTPQEIATALGILGMHPSDVRCAYCGDPKTEWDHLRPLVVGGRPTGYPTSIRNLVPSCSKCSGSKGGQDWKKWMLGNARRSPASRRIPNLLQRIQQLEAYERWASCQPLPLDRLVDRDLWNEYFAIEQEIRNHIRQADGIALRLREQIKDAAKVRQ